jgi:beta-lactamase class D
MTAIDRRTMMIGTAAAIVGGFPPASAQPQPTRIEMQPDFGDAFAEADSAGTFAVLDVAGNRIVVTDRERAEKGFLPASTFKIPNSLIALDTGIVADADATIYRWDKVARDFDAWNRDHTLRSAFKASAVPVYQEIARKIGAERMQEYVAKFDYGNRDIDGAIDMFWLNGDLRVSAMQQIAFLQKLHDGKLPVSARSQEIVRDIMYIEQIEFGTLRGKTGAVGIAQGHGDKATMGWLVGWLEHAGKPPYIFAMNIDVREPQHLALRLPLTKALLKRAIPL